MKISLNYPSLKNDLDYFKALSNVINTSFSLLSRLIL